MRETYQGLLDGRGDLRFNAPVIAIRAKGATVSSPSSPVANDVEAPIVVVIDDNQSVCKSLSNLFRSVDLQVRVFNSAAEFLDSPPLDSPGCLVLDIRLPGLSGLELQAQLARSRHNLPIVMMTGHGDIPMSVRALKAGAVDFLTKPFRDQDMLDAVSQAIEHDRARREKETALQAIVGRHASLTDRERTILEMVSRGLLNKQIAGELGLSEITIKIHRAQAMKKMAVRTVPDLVRIIEMLKANTAHHPE